MKRSFAPLMALVAFLAVAAYASTGQITISGQTSNSGGTSITVGPIVITTSAPIGAVSVVSLSSGDNAITIPSGTTAVLVQLPAANTEAVTLEGASSGTSYGISLLAGGGVAAFQPASGQSSFYLHAAGTVTGVTVTFI